MNPLNEIYPSVLPAVEDKIIQDALKILERRMERGSPLTCSETTTAYFRMLYSDKPVEIFSCLFLDNEHKVIAVEELFKGTVDATMVYPREVARRALELNAAAVVFSHNHPSGNPEPSQADISITRRLKDALEIFDIRVLDHIVIGSQGSESMAERGML